MSATSAVSIRHLRKTYRDGKRNQHKEALKGVSLEIPRGAFFGLLGPNGAGKSTLINIMAGLTVKTSGDVEICGYDAERDMRAARACLGVVPQELVLDVFFSVREALELHAGYYGVPKSERRTDAILKAMGLEDKANIPPRRLSGGMRRRLLIAKALVHAPPVLVLDEPTAGVDVELRTQLWDYVRELNQQGTTILLTTHYLEEAEELCDSIAIINHGEVIACDRKKALMARFDSRELLLTLDKNPLSAGNTAAIDGLETHWDVAENMLVVRYPPSRYTAMDVLQMAQASGLVVKDLSVREAQLEDVFRSLTAA